MKKTLLMGMMLAAGTILIGCGSTSAPTPAEEVDAGTGVATGSADFDTQSADSPEAVVACLNAADATMYGTERCGFCKKQKALLGNAFAQVNYVDCDVDKAACTAAGVQGFPTWVVNGKTVPGYMELDVLTDLCS